jgi:hypothetical protein
MAQVGMRKLESQGPAGPDVVAALLGGVREAETNAGARHADVGDVPLIFGVPHAAASAAI